MVCVFIQKCPHACRFFLVLGGGEGTGLSDGETMERLWSYLRRFSRMTKEMRPSHRIDVLTSALVYYGMQTKEKLGIFC